MGELLRYLLIRNCDSDSRRHELKNEVKTSEEWLKACQNNCWLATNRFRPWTIAQEKSQREKSPDGRSKGNIQELWKADA